VTSETTAERLQTMVDDLEAKLVRARELESSAKAVTRSVQDGRIRTIDAVKALLSVARAEEKSFFDLGDSHHLAIKWRARRKSFQEVLCLLEARP